MEHQQYKLLSIDALREPDGAWVWNDVTNMEEGIFIADEIVSSNRKLLRSMRKMKFLSEESKGKIRVDFAGTLGEIIEFQLRSTGEPILALSQIH